MSVSFWNSQTITAQLPSGLSGLVTISVQGTTGNDAINIMVAPPPTPAISVSPASLQFTSTNGSSPASQSIQIGNTGGGTLAWTATASASWLSLSSSSGTAPSTVSVSINPAGMGAGTYTGSVQITASGATGSPASVAVTLVVQGTQATAGTVTGVTNAGSFQPGFASATWVSIFGTNLSPTTYTWQASDFISGRLPTSLDGVSVTIDGNAAFVEYISPTQINVLAPDDTTVGSVPVQVTVSSQQSNAFTAQQQQFAPAFFSSGGFVAAQHANYTLVSTSQPAAPGEVIMLYGTGFGPTNPALPTAQLVTTPAVLANQVQITIGGIVASVAYAGLVESRAFINSM